MFFKIIFDLCQSKFVLNSGMLSSIFIFYFILFYNCTWVFMFRRKRLVGKNSYQIFIIYWLLRKVRMSPYYRVVFHLQQVIWKVGKGTNLRVLQKKMGVLWFSFRPICAVGWLSVATKMKQIAIDRLKRLKSLLVYTCYNIM